MNRAIFRWFPACLSFILLLGGYVALQVWFQPIIDSDRLCTLVFSLRHRQSFAAISIILCGFQLSLAALVSVWGLNPLEKDDDKSLGYRLISL